MLVASQISGNRIGYKKAHSGREKGGGASRVRRELVEEMLGAEQIG